MNNCRFHCFTMQSIVILLWAVIAVCVVGDTSGTSRSKILPLADAEHGLRIVSGKRVESLAVAPHQVSLRRKQTNKHICGGSIISNIWILTAAHCTVGYDRSYFVAVVGTLTLDAGGDYYDLEKIFNHEMHVPQTISHDIALLKVVREFDANAPYKPIALGDSYIPEGVVLQLTGWGLTSFPGNIPNQLMTFVTKSTSNVQCILGLSNDEGYPPAGNIGQLCTVNEKGQGSCMGDSGGGLVDVEKKQLAGVVSWGIPCARDKPDVYTRVFWYLDWIGKIMKEN